MGLNATLAARQARGPIAVIGESAETSRELISLTRAAGMVGWEGELCRRARGVSMSQAVGMLRWWPRDLVVEALATARSRSSYGDFLASVSDVENDVAVRLLGGFPQLDALVTDLEWLVYHCEPGGRPNRDALLARGFPEDGAERARAFAAALHGFNEDCAARAWERLHVEHPIDAMLLASGARPDAPRPSDFGWSAELVSAAEDRLVYQGLLSASRLTPKGRQLETAVEAEAHLLMADPWETMTESRRTRALGVVMAAAHRVNALPS